MYPLAKHMIKTKRSILANNDMVLRRVFNTRVLVDGWLSIDHRPNSNSNPYSIFHMLFLFHLPLIFSLHHLLCRLLISKLLLFQIHLFLLPQFTLSNIKLLFSSTLISFTISYNFIWISISVNFIFASVSHSLYLMRSNNGQNLSQNDVSES